MFKKQYTARWIEYNILGIKFKIKSKPEHIDTVNLVLESNYGIGNRIFAIINALEYYSPKRINFFWDNQGWVNESFYSLFKQNFPCEIVEYNSIEECKGWTNSKNERTIHFPQASLITEDLVERTLAKNNLSSDVVNKFKKYFQMLEPSDKVKERINSLSLPENYTALQVRNAPDWDDYGRNENLQLFLDEIKTFPKDTIFYLSAMNKDISDFIKNNSDYKICELIEKNYKSMYDAIADLYIMSKAVSGIYSYGSTFGELAWWLADKEQKFTIVGSSERWKSF